MTELQFGGSMPSIFDPNVVVPRCQINRFGQANCDHIHARDLESPEGYFGEPEDLIPLGWTVHSGPVDPRLGQEMFECNQCEALLTLEQTRDHVCELTGA